MTAFTISMQYDFIVPSEYKIQTDFWEAAARAWPEEIVNLIKENFEVGEIERFNYNAIISFKEISNMTAADIMAILDLYQK